MSLEFTKIKSPRKEHYNFKSEECHKLFTDITETTTKLTECLDNNFSAETKSKIWEKELNRIFFKAFQKKQIVNSNKKSSSLNSLLLEERRNLIRKMARCQTPELSLKISELEEKIGEENIKMNTYNMRTQLSSCSNFVTIQNTNGCWSLVRKTRPKYLPTVPVGKINSEGNMITDQKGLKELYLDTFLWRLRDRPIRPDMKDLQSVKT